MSSKIGKQAVGERVSPVNSRRTERTAVVATPATEVDGCLGGTALRVSQVFFLCSIGCTSSIMNAHGVMRRCDCRRCPGCARARVSECILIYEPFRRSKLCMGVVWRPRPASVRPRGRAPRARRVPCGVALRTARSETNPLARRRSVFMLITNSCTLQRPGRLPFMALLCGDRRDQLVSLAPREPRPP